MSDKTWRIELDALRGADEIAAYYESKSPGLGDVFTAALDARLRHMEAMPRIGSVERYAGVDVRRRQVDGYEKYLVVYAELPDAFVVVSVMHGRRHPRRWKRRIRALR